MVLWVGLQYVIVVFSDHTHLHIDLYKPAFKLLLFSIIPLSRLNRITSRSGLLQSTSAVPESRRLML